MADRPTLTFLAVMIAGSFMFTGMILRLLRRARVENKSPEKAEPIHHIADTGMSAGKQLGLILIVGLAARIAMMPGPAILEDDYFRYQWDGAVTAAGQNPYAHAPGELVTPPEIRALVKELGQRPAALPKGYKKLAQEGEQILLKTNNPHVTTIYTPLTQIAFAAAHKISPWSLTGWKIIILLCELAAFAFLALALQRAGKPPFWIIIYWWHPLVIKEFSNSLHMDVLLMPFLAAMLWLLVSGRQRSMSIAAAMAGAIKFWPLLILPALWNKGRRSLFWGGWTAIIALLLVAPQIMALGDNAGLARYSADWQRNALLFPILSGIFQPIFDDAGSMIRLALAAGLGLWALRLWQKHKDNYDAKIGAAGSLILALCLLSPTGYPWYAIWIAPLAVLQPRPIWLIFMACAPFYYLDFYFQGLGRAETLWWLPPLLSAGPVWIMVIAGAAGRIRNKQRGQP